MGYTINRKGEKMENLIKERVGRKMVAKKINWSEVFTEAKMAGMKALMAKVPEPMIVAEHENPLDDGSKVKKAYFVGGGVCGFASIIVKPGTSSFAKWLMKKDLGHKSYYGGVGIWVHEGGQSYEKKVAYANAFADILEKYDIKVHVDSRLD